jgi:hypothetical protein
MLEITLPTLFSGQIQVARMLCAHRLVAMRCGRRYGKTELDKAIACDRIAKGQSIGFFTHMHRHNYDFFTQCRDILSPIVTDSSMMRGTMQTRTGGRLDIHSLENETAGRGRKYHGVIIDEAAFAKPNLKEIWSLAIRPTLLDYGGWALATSTPNGIDPENFFWAICNDPMLGWRVYHAPTHDNPHLDRLELDKLQRDNPPLVYRQEYLAEFVDWSGDAFFSLDDMLDDEKRPFPMPVRCDAVFAVIDTATKTGRKRDGTAVSFFAYDRHAPRPLMVLDWEITQIEGSMLEMWLPTALKRLEELARQCGARRGSIGALIEDQASGSILLQQAARRGWPARPLDGVLTSVGKDERAISVSGYVYRKKVALTVQGFDRTMQYKGITRNHFIGQVCGFHIGVDNKDDDLLDTFTYGVSIALGDSRGV